MLDGVVALFESPLGLTLLALTAFGDALIGFNAFIFGEVAFLAAGAVAASRGNYLLIIVVLCAAWSADLASYWIGRRIDGPVKVWLLKRRKHRRRWRKIHDLSRKHGFLMIVASRFMGPAGWMTMFASGAFSLPLRTVIPASFLGVLLGAGQFIAYGALGTHFGDAIASAFIAARAFMYAHLGAILLLAVSMVTGSFVVWTIREKRWSRAIGACALLVLTFFASNIFLFFASDVHARKADVRPPAMTSVAEMLARPLVVRAGTSPLHVPQPVNVVLIGRSGPDVLMARLGWIRNETYTRDRISLAEFGTSLLTGILPVSELFYEGAPADSAYQMPGSIVARTHIRWWHVGDDHNENQIHIASISHDEELAIKLYMGSFALLHDIDPNVDQAREALAAQISRLEGERWDNVNRTATAPVTRAEGYDFHSDGKVLLVKEIEPLQERRLALQNVNLVYATDLSESSNNAIAAR